MATAKWQRQNGNGMVETRHKLALMSNEKQFVNVLYLLK